MGNAVDTENRQEAHVAESTSAQVTEQRSREDAEDLAVALPRLERYRKGQAQLIGHEELMRDLDIDVE